MTMMIDGLVASIREYKVAWMLGLFVGVLYWAFKARFRR
jgi:cbb3-type cytochrome oxidase subunit 3